MRLTNRQGGNSVAELLKTARRGLGLVIAALLLPTVAFALEGQLAHPSGWVIVYRSKAAMEEGEALIRSSADPEVIGRLVVKLGSCAVRTGTRAVSTVQTEGSMWTGYALPVTVIDGPFVGCRGFVRLKDFQSK